MSRPNFDGWSASLATMIFLELREVHEDAILLVIFFRSFENLDNLVGARVANEVCNPATRLFPCRWLRRCCLGRGGKAIDDGVNSVSIGLQWSHFSPA